MSGLLVGGQLIPFRIPGNRVELLGELFPGKGIQRRNDRVHQASGMPLQGKPFGIGQPEHKTGPHHGWTAQCIGVRQDEIRHEVGLRRLERHRQSLPEGAASQCLRIEPAQHVHQGVGGIIQASQKHFQLGGLIA